MARDNSPRARQESRLLRKQGKRSSSDRILIVSEGTKTEKNYFEEIRRELRLPTANIKVLPCAIGTCPLQVANYTFDLFIHGDKETDLQPRAFEKIYAVFDRDAHQKYYNALEFIQAKNSKLTFNDQRKKISFEAIASVPNFELWLLLHYEDVRAPIHRHEAIDRLKVHIPNYEKGSLDIYSQTKLNISDAHIRTSEINNLTTEYDGNEPFSKVNELVKKLTQLVKRR